MMGFKGEENWPGKINKTLPCNDIEANIFSQFIFIEIYTALYGEA